MEHGGALPHLNSAVASSRLARSTATRLHEQCELNLTRSKRSRQQSKNTDR